MKVELSIKSDYFPEWGASEGLRELLANARDAVKELGASMDVRYRKETGTLVIENDGATLPHEALLLGHTTKLGKSGVIGRFGEGLKGGVLALVRAGHEIKIRSGAEVWVPKIERSDKFDAKVLVFYVHTGREPKDRVSIEIGNVHPDTYDQLGDHFLFLGKIKDSERVETSSGTLLLADRFNGKLFVKGIYVQREDEFSYGYDLSDAEIDRDRKMLARYDVNFRVSQIWQRALVTRPDLLDPFSALLAQQRGDLDGINQYNAPLLDDATKTAVAADFVKRHGSDALPVSQLAESQEVAHLGKRGIVCSGPLRLILEQTLGSVADNKIKLAAEVVKTYGWHELSDAEQENLKRAIRMVNAAEPLTLGDVDVVDCRDPNLRGLFKDGRVLLTKKILVTRDLALRVCVHEAAHKAGGDDGEKSHVANIERIWSTIVGELTLGE